MNVEDTIVAIATPVAPGGLGVIRLSGAAAGAIAHKILSLRPGASLRSWRLQMAEVVDPQGAVLDHALASYFAKPRSYTGEDVVEISCHGSPVILRYLVERCLTEGARLAEPGEFTMRAFLNGRIDLTQAEAVRDLIDAQTLYQAKLAAQQVDGSVSHWIAPWKKELVDLIALLEAGIDFAEDDVSILSQSDLAKRICRVAQGLAGIVQSFRVGKIIHSGLTLAIVGRPNVGKSSLFNCLLQQQRAIVTATPGTTRDLVSETVEIGGIPLRFVDTAGVRKAFDEAEAMGVVKSFEAAAESDLALLVLDGSAGLTSEDRDLIEKLNPPGKLIIVVNKSDLPARIMESDLRQYLKRKSVGGVPVVFVSALRKEGMERLRELILQSALPSLSGAGEAQYLTNLRHEQLVRQSVEGLEAARSAMEQNLPHEMLLLDLYHSLHSLDDLTGQTTVEDILGQIFSTFCIGK